ncbi:MAG: class I SAM-dependent methyltransferase [Anaerolineae bacterium]|jgi:SAM-dependent methyltransferase|nr:class I SAM-dependent methyltransferase [Chloroflexota bacterium]
MSGDTPFLHGQTARLWDAAAALYERDAPRDTERLRSGWSSLLPHEQRLLTPLLPCRRALHLQCAGGSDTLSLWRLGAQAVLGVDIAPRMVAVARQKARALRAPAGFWCGDVLDAPARLDGQADLIYTGKGALPWMMDLVAWAEVVARLLAPGGRLFIHEGHPLDWVWDPQAPTYRLSPRTGDYFQRQPVADRSWPASAEVVQAQQDQELHGYERQWTLGEVVTAVANAGLRIERLVEHPETFWDQWTELDPALLARLPHSFTLIAVQP